MVRTPKPASRQTDFLHVLDRLEHAFGARAIIYATGTRNPANLFGGQMASDVLPIVGTHLDAIGEVDRLALLIHTKGGQLETPWPLVNMLRHHATKELYVLVPEFALSAGTLVALGAEKIYMLPHAFLSPVDPTGQFNIEGKQQSYSIEDVMGYVDFVTERVGIRDQAALVEALKQLTQEVKATILGSIHRTRSLIERLGTNLLQLHMKTIEEQKRVTQIVDMLTHSLFTHQHMIPRTEAAGAIGFGDIIGIPDDKQAKALVGAREYLRRELQCNEPFDPEGILADAIGSRKKMGPQAAKTPVTAAKQAPTDQQAPTAGQSQAADEPCALIESKRAIVGSRYGEHLFMSKYRITQPAGGPIQVRPIGGAAWKLVKHDVGRA